MMFQEYLQKESIRKNLWFSFLISALLIIFAFILLFKEGDIISTLVLVVGYLALIFGCLEFVRFFRLEDGRKGYSRDAFYGLVYFFFGIIGILRSEILATMLTYLLGASMIYKNASRFQICLNFGVEKKSSLWNYLLIFSVLGIILGLVIILNPMDGKVALTKVIAYCVIISEVIHVIQGMAMLVGSGKKNEEQSSKE